MGKVIFEFNDQELEDKESIGVHMKAWNTQIAIDEFDNYLRGRLKYEQLSEPVYEALDAARTELNRLLYEGL